MKPFFVCLFCIILGGSGIAQQNETILSVHKKGTHSVGGIYVPVPAGNGWRHYLNTRYSYSITNQSEIGIDIFSYIYGNQASNGDWAPTYLITPSLYYRKYLGKKGLGAFFETGYKTRIGIYPNKYFNENTSLNELTGGHYSEVLFHAVYGSVGFYFHGFAKNRLGLEAGIGVGPGYFPQESPTWGFGVMDIQFRLKYFFPSKKD